jgi:hypothetical protein
MNLRSCFITGLLVALATLTAAFAADVGEKSTTGQRPVSREVPLIVPNYLADQDFFQASHTLHDSGRVQQVYNASEFWTGPILIRGFYWRPSADTNYGFRFQTVLTNFQVNLSTTSAQADQLSSTFADNIGPDETVVFQGKTRIASRFKPGPGNTRQFDIFVRFKHPFFYDPAQGNLLVDIRNFQFSGAAYVSEFGGSDGGSRAVAFDPNATTADFTDTGVDVLKVVFTRVRAR